MDLVAANHTIPESTPTGIVMLNNIRSRSKNVKNDFLMFEFIFLIIPFLYSLSTDK